jgi:hypothetical protein
MCEGGIMSPRLTATDHSSLNGISASGFGTLRNCGDVLHATSDDALATTRPEHFARDFAEACAKALTTDLASLLMRDPSDPEDQAKPIERRQIGEMMKAICRTGS